MSEKKSTKPKWEVTNHRFVAFLDIMGFKDMVMRNTHEEIYERMEKISKTKDIVESIVNINKIKKLKDVDIQITSFSDSIVIFSNDNSINSFNFFLLSTRAIVSYCINELIPVKGSISYGLTSVNREKQIFFGQSIIDAFLLQEEVNYYGVVFHNTVDKFIFDNKKVLKETNYFSGLTFLKSGQIQHRNLIWFEFLHELNDKEAEEEEEVFFRIMEGLQTITSGNPRKYIDNTIEMYERYKALME